MKPVWKFVLLNVLVLAGLVGSLFVVPGDTSLLKLAVVAAIVIAFSNYSLVVLPHATDKNNTEETRRRAWKEYRSTAMMAAAWVYLTSSRGQFGLILVAVCTVMMVVVGGAIWIAKKSAPSEP
jgi:hypothetical protein